CKEALVQLARETAATAVGTDADEVDVRLVRKALREEAVEEAHQLAVLLRDEARLPEMLEEEPREERAHRASVPPVVDERGDPVVIRRLRIPDCQRHGATVPHSSHVVTDTSRLRA